MTDIFKVDKMLCARRISQGLKIRQMKQSELCDLTNIPKSAMSQYLSGNFKPKQDRIYLISKALNVSEAWLMGYDVPMERTTTIPLTDTYRVVAKDGIPGTHVVTSDPNITDKLAELIEVTKDLTPEQIDKLIKMAEII